MSVSVRMFFPHKGIQIVKPTRGTHDTFYRQELGACCILSRRRRGRRTVLRKLRVVALPLG